MRFFVFILLYIFSIVVYSNNTPSLLNTKFSSNADYFFIENKGQVKNNSGATEQDVQFYLERENTTIYLMNQGIAWQFNKVNYPKGYVELRNKKNLNSHEQKRL